MTVPVADATRIVETSLPDVDVRRCTRLDGTNAVFEVRTVREGRSDLVVKVRTVSDRRSFLLDPTVTRFVSARTDVPSPSVVHVDASTDRYPREYFVTERAAGARCDPDGASERSFDRTIESAGRVLAALHDDTGFPRFGLLCRRSGSDVEIAADVLCDREWNAFFRRLTASRVKAVTDPRLRECARRVARAVRERSRLLGDGDAVLVHDDFRPRNVLVDERGAIQSVLDWENAIAAHWEYGIVRAEYLFSRRRKPPGEWLSPDRRLLDSYAAASSRLFDEEFRTRRLLYLLSCVAWELMVLDSASRIDISDGTRRERGRELRSFVETLCRRLRERT